jgi:secreted trypsin-like serine protease
MKKFLPLLLVAFFVFPALASAERDNSTKIVNGTPAAIEDWPSIAAVYPGNSLCGGTLIAKRWVLTAAHCAVISQAEDWEVVIGSSSRLASGVGVKGIYPHPMYDDYTLTNDIALVKLKNPSSHPVQKLATSSPEVGTSVKVAGWGVTCFNDITNCLIQDNLREVTVQIKDYSQCYFSYADAGIFLPPGTICASDTDKDSCQGDSGGPLIAGEGADRRLIGVVSNGIGCADEDFPGIYTDVSRYLDWIGSYIGTINVKKRVAIKKKGVIKITNTSNLKTKITKLKIKGSKRFKIKKSTCYSSIAPGASCTVKIVKKNSKRPKARLAISNSGGVIKVVKLIG